jgi:carboxymethylenebutenolidase
VDELEQILTANGKDYEFRRYENAGHGFFTVDRAMYRVEAANDGWEQIVAFHHRHLGAPVSDPIGG